MSNIHQVVSLKILVLLTSNNNECQWILSYYFLPAVNTISATDKISSGLGTIYFTIIIKERWNDRDSWISKVNTCLSYLCVTASHISVCHSATTFCLFVFVDLLVLLCMSVLYLSCMCVSICQYIFTSVRLFVLPFSHSICLLRIWASIEGDEGDASLPLFSMGGQHRKCSPTFQFEKN